MQSKIEFIKKYIYALFSCAYLFTLGVFSSKHRKTVYSLCDRFGYGKHKGGIPSVRLSDVIDDKFSVCLGELKSADGNVSLTELICIANLVKQCAPSKLFEIGTFDGRTTLNLAYNTCGDAKIYTLDLPADKIASTKLLIEDADKPYIDKKTTGQRYYMKDNGKIVQLYGDSATFDFSPFFNTIDFIFIDGSHSYEYALNDSKIACRLLKNGKGTIVWHDYDPVHWPGVARALDAFYATEEFKGLRHIEGTSLVYLIQD